MIRDMFFTFTLGDISWLKLGGRSLWALSLLSFIPVAAAETRADQVFASAMVFAFAAAALYCEYQTERWHFAVSSLPSVHNAGVRLVSLTGLAITFLGIAVGLLIVWLAMNVVWGDREQR